MFLANMSVECEVILHERFLLHARAEEKLPKAILEFDYFH